MTTTQASLPLGKDGALLAGRLLMASLFLFSGLQKAFDLKGAAAFASQYDVPFALQLMPLVIILEVGAALCFITGRFTRPAAIALAIWMTWTGPWFHRFWNVEPQMWQMMIDNFFHHLVMIGGMIYLAACGPGRLVLGAPASP
jgi:putative oxidoreductase